MTNNWEVKILGEVAEFQQGLQIAKNKRLNTKAEGTLPLLKITDMISGNFPEFIKIKEIPASVIALNNDIILTRTGQVGFIFTNLNGVVHNNCFKVIPDNKKADRLFIYYYLKSPNVQSFIRSVASGSAQPDLTHKAFRHCPISLPPLPTQKKIGYILSNYDDLIENNTRRIKILEEMAQTLYHEWFVKFRFPGHEQVKMVEYSWEKIKIKIKDLPIQIIDGDRSKKYPKSDEFQTQGILFLNTKNIVDNKLDLQEANYITLEKFSEITKGRVQPLDIVMTTRGSIGKLALFNCEYLTGLINAQMLILRADNKSINQLFLFYLMSSEEFQEIIKSFASGSAQPQIPIQDLKQIEIICPPIELQNKFSDFTLSINQFIKNLQIKNKNLRATRDLLLPKLISGEIDVENLEIDTVEIAA